MSAVAADLLYDRGHANAMSASYSHSAEPVDTHARRMTRRKLVCLPSLENEVCAGRPLRTR
jgi:hypothetical protein